MRSVEENLSTAIDRSVVVEFLEAYGSLVAQYRKGDLDACLNHAGKFVEHVLRAVEFIRKSSAPPEIRNAAQVIREIENDVNLTESLRVLVPKVAQAIYQIRSKRGAVHVKEIGARQIDAALCVQAASWIIAELLRLYHIDDEDSVMQAMGLLARSQTPLIEMFGDEAVVTSKVPGDIELLLLVTKSEPTGIDRRTLGLSSKLSAPSVTRGVQQLEKLRFVHRTKDGYFHITGPGERYLSDHLAQKGLWSSLHFPA
jgi:hypothetical protein